MKYIILLFAFAFNIAVAQEVYYNEDFQSVSIAPNSDSDGILVQGWNNYNPLGVSSFADVVRLEGTNQFIRLKSPVSKMNYGIESPEILIKENTKLKFKVAVTNKTNEGILKIKVQKDNGEEDIVADFSFDTILSDDTDSDFTNGNFDTTYEKEVNLSAYAGQQLKFHFEILVKTNVDVWLFLDDIKLIKEETMIPNQDQNEPSYYSEDFQNVSIPHNEDDNTFSMVLPQGWHDYNVKVERFQGENQFLVFKNDTPNEVYHAGMPELLIKENTILTFKIGLANKGIPKGEKIGTFKIKKIKGVETELIKEFDFDEILVCSTEFTGGEVNAKFEKKIDLSAYAGQQLELYFEMVSTKLNAGIYLDDIKLVQETTITSDEPDNEAYCNENFQSILVPEHSSSNQFPQGWNNYDSESLVARLDGTNQFILFENQIANKSYKLRMPEFLIKENTRLKFKIAVTDNTRPGTFSVKIFSNTEDGARGLKKGEKIITVFSVNDIIAFGKNGETDFFINDEPDARYEKEVDLSAYAGQKIQVYFEMLAEKPNLKLFLDDIKLVKERTMTINDHIRETFVIYPNPADNYFTIRLNNGIVKENQLYALDGRLVKTTGNSDNIWIGDLPKGIYLVRITDDSGNQFTHKIIKK